MTPEDSLSVAVRGHLSGTGVMSEVKMFGGTGFMLNRNMVAAVSKRGPSARTDTVRLSRGQGRGRWRCGDARWKATSISTRPSRRMTRSKDGSTKPWHL